MLAIKGNRVYTVSEQEKQAYLNRGFDIADDNGEIIEHGKGKTVSYDEYAKIKAELEKLKAKKSPKGEDKGEEK